MNKSLAFAALFISSSCFAAINTSLVDAITKSDLEKVEFMLNGTNIITKENKTAYLELAQEIIEQRKDEVQDWLKPYATFKLALRSGIMAWHIHSLKVSLEKFQQASLLQLLSSEAGTPEGNAKLAGITIGGYIGNTFGMLVTIFTIYLTYNAVKEGRAINDSNVKAFTNAMKIKHLIQLC